jgi:tRNA isopentenyl-2-thiomethyl-A-37 hydroxylase MiaE
MPYFDYDGEIHIDTDEFLSALDIRERQRLIDALIENGYIKDRSKNDRYGASESIFEDALDKLHDKWNALSKEEEEAIIKISKRF